MDKDLKYLAENVLKRETNKFLIEIERLMKEDKVEEALAGKKENQEKFSKNEQKKNKKPDKIPGTTQFKSLMDAAEEAACIEELLLFLIYQKSKKEGWEYKCNNGKDIASNVVDSFLKIQNEIYKKIEGEFEESQTREKEGKTEKRKITDEEERELRLEIAKKYTGYLFWKASAVSKSKEEK